MIPNRGALIDALIDSEKGRLEFVRKILVAQDSHGPPRPLDPERRELFEAILFEAEKDLRWLEHVLTSLDITIAAKDDEIARLRRPSRRAIQSNRARRSSAK